MSSIHHQLFFQAAGSSCPGGAATCIPATTMMSTNMAMATIAVPRASPSLTTTTTTITAAARVLRRSNNNYSVDYSTGTANTAMGRDDTPLKSRERRIVESPYVPVYVMLPSSIINLQSELTINPDGLQKRLKILKSINVDGIVVNCWWGIVERRGPRHYNWSGYKTLFQLIRDLDLKLQVVMSFHKCTDCASHIPLPFWVEGIGVSNPDIFFTDKKGRQNKEYLSFGVNKERLFRGRTAYEAYYEFMQSFRIEFAEFFDQGVITEIEIGLGPCGELRYPSYPSNKYGGRYPGIGGFQCHDPYLMKSLMEAADERGHPSWGKGPENAGCCTSQPHESGFFCHGGDFDSPYGRFFLKWYSQILIDHADHVLSQAKLVFSDNHNNVIRAIKLPCVPWWYKTTSHPAELTAGFYNSCNRDGYTAITAILEKHGAALNLTNVELPPLTKDESYPEVLSDPRGIFWQVLNAAWDVGITVSSGNSLPCYDREGYDKLIEKVQPALHHPDGNHLAAYKYRTLSHEFMKEQNIIEFQRFVKKMHGEEVEDLYL